VRRLQIAGTQDGQAPRRLALRLLLAQVGDEWRLTITHDRHVGPQHPLPLLLFTLAVLGLLGIVLWRLWTEVLHAWPA
jgi:hypothetical protein